MRLNLITFFCIVSVTFLSYAATYSQKLPAIQQKSLRAPSNIRIDGKANEWDDKFQAYNNHVEFSYTLSNNDENLYLTVQALEKSVIRHIMNGGISLIVNRTVKKNDKDGLSATYPLFDHNIMFSPEYYVTNTTSPGTVRQGGSGRNSYASGAAGSGVTFGISDGPSPRQGRPGTPAQADSLMKANNTSFNNKAKNIGLKGFKTLDTLISVYNEDGIKAAGAFDNKGAYTYELAIPLKYFSFDTRQNEKFVYHIVVNEVEQKGIDITYGTGADGAQKITGVRMSSNSQVAQPATDFWGQYALANKP